MQTPAWLARFAPFDEARAHRVQADGAELCVLELPGDGRDDGPCAVLVHGFPDTPASMAPLAGRLHARGWRVLLPVLRGYAPSSPVTVRDAGVDRLGADVLAVCDALDARDALLVGHDWGAISVMSAAVQAPERALHLVALAVPPIAAFVRNSARHPRQLVRSAYIARFQRPGAARRELLRDDLALVDALWRRWSPGLPEADAAPYIEATKHALRDPAHAGAAIALYRAFVPRTAAWPAAARVAFAKVPATATFVAGADDGCIGPQIFDGAARHVAGPCAVHIVERAGHWIHLEQLDAVEQIVVTAEAARG